MSCDPALRWLAVWLKRLPTDRLRAAAPPEAPLVCYAREGNAFVLSAVDARAHKRGLSPGMALADARAMQPGLVALEADAGADAALLDRIAAWCARYSPAVVLDPPDGLFLDISGCAHLFGGEAALLADVTKRLKQRGFVARCAIAPTPGAAWALARWRAGTIIEASQVETHPPPERGSQEGVRRAERRVAKRSPRDLQDSALLHPPPHGSPFQGEEEPSRQTTRGSILSALAPLPVAGLRLQPEAAAFLARAGLKTVGQIAAAPRSAFAARAGEHALLRLDQALGRAREALTPRRPAPKIFAVRRLLEPIFDADALLEVAATLIADALVQLDKRNAGVRDAALTFFGVDGADLCVPIRMSCPERAPRAMLRLVREKLQTLPSWEDDDLGGAFGFEAARLDVHAFAQIDARPTSLDASMAQDASLRLAALVDVLSARLGPAQVTRPVLVDAHMPEKAEGWQSALTLPFSPARGSGGEGQNVPRRPLTLFAHPQPVEALAIAPDGPPVRFVWRRVSHAVKRAEGPERIAGDWLAGGASRDYYRVEDDEGRRYWIFRVGAYGRGAAPRWFVHGLFA